MNPISDKQAKLMTKLYPEATWDEIRALSSQEASKMIDAKLNPNKPKVEAIRQSNASNGARIGCAVNNAVLLLSSRFKNETTIENMTQSIESLARELIHIMERLENGR